MPRSYRHILAGLIAVACLRTGWAEDLLGVYQDALINDPQLAEAAANRLADFETKPQARALLLPDIRVSGQQGYEFNIDESSSGLSSQFGGVDGNVSGFDDTEDSQNTHNYSLNLTQSLYRRGNFIQNRRAKTVVKRADVDFLTAEQVLVLRVAERYFDVLFALDDLTFRIAEKEAIARQLEQAKRRFEVGLITITDVHEAQARFDLAVADEIQARNDLSDAREALREVTGVYYDKLSELGEGMPLELPEPANPDAWVNQAMKSNPQLLSTAFAVDIALEDIELQKSGHYPTLDLVASYDDTDSGNFETSSNSVRLQLNIPLYEGGAVISRTREAAHRREAAKQRLENQQRQVVRQVRDAYRGVQAAISRVKALDQARVSNQSALEATEAGFDVGTRTIVDVLDAQRDLFRARRDYSQSRYAYILNRLRLRQAAGQVSEEDLAEYNHWLVEPQSDQYDTLFPALDGEDGDR